MITKIKLSKINGVLNDNIYAEVRYIEEENFGDMLLLYQKVSDTLCNHSWLKFRDFSYLKNVIDNGGFILGCYVENVLIASALCETPSNNYIDDALFSGICINDLKNTFVFGYVMVDPLFRGNSLHSILIDLRINISKSKGKKYILTAVAEENIYSLKNILECGFEIKLRKENEYGVMRDLLVKDLNIVDENLDYMCM